MSKLTWNSGLNFLSGVRDHTFKDSALGLYMVPWLVTFAHCAITKKFIDHARTGLIPIMSSVCMCRNFGGLVSLEDNTGYFKVN